MDLKELPVEAIEGDDALMRDATGSVLTDETLVASPTVTAEVPLQRYEALYKYSKECLDEERSRYDCLRCWPLSPLSCPPCSTM